MDLGVVAVLLFHDGVDVAGADAGAARVATIARPFDVGGGSNVSIGLACARARNGAHVLRLAIVFDDHLVRLLLVDVIERSSIEVQVGARTRSFGRHLDVSTYTI